MPSPEEPKTRQKKVPETPQEISMPSQDTNNSGDTDTSGECTEEEGISNKNESPNKKKQNAFNQHFNRYKKTIGPKELNDKKTMNNLRKKLEQYWTYKPYTYPRIVYPTKLSSSQRTSLRNYISKRRRRLKPNEQNNSIFMHEWIKESTSKWESLNTSSIPQIPKQPEEGDTYETMLTRYLAENISNLPNDHKRKELYLLRKDMTEDNKKTLEKILRKLQGRKKGAQSQCTDKLPKKSDQNQERQNITPEESNKWEQDRDNEKEKPSSHDAPPANLESEKDENSNMWSPMDYSEGYQSDDDFYTKNYYEIPPSPNNTDIKMQDDSGLTPSGIIWENPPDYTPNSKYPSSKNSFNSQTEEEVEWRDWIKWKE